MIQEALLLGFAVMALFGGYHRVRSNLSGERLDRRQEGRAMFWALRGSGLLLFLGFLAWFLRPEWLQPGAVALPLWVRWSGIVLFYLATALFAWTLHTLGRNLTDTVVTRREHTLVTHGPYRYVRHPFYVAFVASIGGTALATGNLFFLGVGMIVFVLLDRRLGREEAALEARFGDAYRRYRATTPRYIPRCWR